MGLLNRIFGARRANPESFLSVLLSYALQVPPEPTIQFAVQSLTHLIPSEKLEAHRSMLRVFVVDWALFQVLDDPGPKTALRETYLRLVLRIERTPGVVGVLFEYYSHCAASADDPMNGLANGFVERVGEIRDEYGKKELFIVGKTDVLNMFHATARLLREHGYTDKSFV